VLEESRIPQLKLDPEIEKLAWDARARLTWGNPPEEVKAWLLGSGADQDTAKKILAACMRERAQSLRGKGRRDLLIAFTLIAASAGVAIAVIYTRNFAGERNLGISQTGAAVIWAVCFLAIMYGLRLVWQGATRLLLGARTKGADSDVEG
jgi:hypothetical protein